jgi:tRNA dimethylallyltransferase
MRVPEALQCRRGRSLKTRRCPQRSPPCHLRIGNNWIIAGCGPAADFDGHSLLAQHPLELALNVSLDDRPQAGGEPLLLVILGPTGSGKTALSIALAQKFAGEIVNCDSVAMYREFDIGTAKPTPAERAQVPHHLLDYVHPTQEVTAGEYARQARQVLAEVRERRHLPVVVGGTGLYLRALLEGLFAGPQRSEELRERLRKRAASRGPDYLHRILSRLDPVVAEKVHPHDEPKLIRAIEVCLASRQKMSELWRQERDPLRGFRMVRLGLDPDRGPLYERINQRAIRMFEQGLIEETEKLIEKYGVSARPLLSLGYKQAAQFLRGELSRSQAVQAAQQGHRNYAKRQMTWFRREPDVTWLKGFGDDPQIQREAITLVGASILQIHAHEH